MAFVNLTNGPIWIGINSSHLDSYCGHGDNQLLTWALDGSSNWYHWHLDGDEHWLILDLGAVFNIQEIRGRSDNSLDPTDVDIYVSETNGDWGAAVASGISTWQDTTSWEAIELTPKRGRYILIDIRNTEDPVGGELQWGVPSNPILDVFAVIVADYAVSSSTGSLSVFTSLVGSSDSTSGASCVLSVATKLKGPSAATSGVSGVLSVTTELKGSSAATSGVSGYFTILTTELKGFAAGISDVFGVLTVTYIPWEGSSIATSGVSGVLSVDTSLAGIVTEISGVSGKLFSVDGLVGSVAAISSVTGQVTVLFSLSGSAVVTSSASARILHIPVGFYESLINQITAYFQDIADTNNLTVRYENDPRSTPADGLWCDCNIDFGDTDQSELGVASFRHIGNFVVKIKNPIGLGTSELLQTADIIASAFRTTDLNRIIFNVPRIRDVGRVDDNYQFNVICPFFSDKVGR